jgi:hypothetical protein
MLRWRGERACRQSRLLLTMIQYHGITTAQTPSIIRSTSFRAGPCPLWKATFIVIKRKILKNLCERRVLPQ